MSAARDEVDRAVAQRRHGLERWQELDVRVTAFFAEEPELFGGEGREVGVRDEIGVEILIGWGRPEGRTNESSVPSVHYAVISMRLPSGSSVTLS